MSDKIISKVSLLDSMPDGSKDSEIASALAGIQKQLKSIQNTMKSFEGRIASLEQAVEQKLSADGENPLIYSRVLMKTLETIGDYEKEHGHGIVAKDLAAIRNLEPPTVYDHLTKLEAEKMIFWQRGTELGLKPYNGKFYSVSNRDEALEDIPVLMSLPDTIIPIAQTILKSSSDGVTREELLKMLLSLKESGERPWKGMHIVDVEATLDEALQVLLRRVLIDHKKRLDGDFYYPRSR
ncbi:MAG: hypothetical protein JW779_14080 [Candidatus Thorarchaeota archaeon]|nr:hypothetical protein [Candidatus Thorarchaeota archaeon]